MNSRQDIRAAHHAVATVCPGLTVDREPTWTETSLLLRGHVHGRRVIAKYPIDQRPFWLDRARHEITVYRALRSLAPLPVTVPGLIAADPSHPVLITTELPGRPLALDRYPTSPIRAADLDAVLGVLGLLHTWRPPIPTAIPYDDNYPDQLTALRPLIGDRHHQILIDLYTLVAGRIGLEVHHGDPHLGNFLRLPDGRLAVIDLEFLAWRLPGHDLAMLWILLGDTPNTARDHLLNHLNGSPEHHAAFWCASALVCVREITSHQRQDHHRHRSRLARLRHDLRVALDHAHRHHRQLIAAIIA